MEQKNLQIENASVSEEVIGDKKIDTSEQFLQWMKVNEISEVLSNPNVKVKQLGSKYIFSIKGKNDSERKNQFYVNGINTVEHFIQAFYDDKAKQDSRDAVKKASVDIVGLEIICKISTTQNELNVLQQQVQENTDKHEAAVDLPSIKGIIMKNKDFYAQIIDEAKERTSFLKRVGNKREVAAKWKIQLDQAKKRLDSALEIEKIVKELEEGRSKNQSVDQYIMQERLISINEKLEQIGKEGPSFNQQAMALRLEEDEGLDNTTYYPIKITNLGDAQRFKSALNGINWESKSINEVLRSDARKSELAKELGLVKTYLDKVINEEIDPVTNPYKPTYLEAYNSLLTIDPTLRRFIGEGGKPKSKEKDAYTIKVGSTVGGTSGNTETGTTTPTETGKTGSAFDSTGEAFRKGGIAGAVNYRLDQSNMKPETKNFRGGVGNLAIAGGVIFVGWKMISSAFKLLTKKGRSEEELGKNLAWLGIPAALIFGSQARSGEGPLALFRGGNLTDKIANMFSFDNNKEGETTSPQTKEVYTEGLQGVLALFGGKNVTYGKMAAYMEYDGRKMRIKDDRYDELLKTYKDDKNEAAVKFLERIGKKDKRNMLDLSLDAMGITREALNKPGDQDKKFDEKASNAIARLSTVYQFMEGKGYDKINTDTMDLITEYVKSDEDEDYLEELEARGDVFEKEATVIDDITGNQAIIKDLVKDYTDKNDREEEILKGLNKFYSEWNFSNTTGKEIKLRKDGTKIYVKTYGQETEIDLKNKTIEGLDVSFSGYAEMFRAVNLTNRLGDICKDKVANKADPFYIGTLGDIYFNEASIFSTSFDTKLVSGAVFGVGGALKKISPALEQKDNKQKYCDYLNKTVKYKKFTPAAETPATA